MLQRRNIRRFCLLTRNTFERFLQDDSNCHKSGGAPSVLLCSMARYGAMPFRPRRTACAMLHNEHVLYVSMCDDDARDGSCNR
jgi:hypothetical protein